MINGERKHFRSAIIVLLSVSFLSISFFFQSRAFFLGVIFAGIVLCLYHVKAKRNLKLTVTALFAILALTVVFFVKLDSSAGRILIYKISFEMWKDNWLAGIGWGNFKSLYMHYQAAYFNHGNYTVKELLLADNTYFAFNEYLQFIIEMGIFGLLIIVLIAYLLCRLMVNLLQRYPTSLIVNTLIGILLTIHFAGLFTYCFHVIYIFSFYLAVLITLLVCLVNENSVMKFYHSFSILSLLFLFCFFGINYQFIYDKYLAIRDLDVVKQKEGIGQLNDAYRFLRSLEPKLYSNADFLELKSRLCYALWKLDEAEQATLALIKVRPSNLVYGRLGNVYKAKKNMLGAEKAYATAIDMVPNRFIERYRLYQLYKEIGEVVKAKKVKEDILQLPVKIPSEMIENIKTNINNEQ